MEFTKSQNPTLEISMAIRQVFSNWKNLFAASIFSIGFFVLLVMIPVWTTPGSDFFFHLKLVDTQLVVIMVILSLLNGVLLVMQLYLQIEKWKLRRRVATGSGLTAVVAMLFGLVSASVACVACYSSLIAFVGLGATTFIFEYRYYLTGLSLLLVMIALWYTAKAVNGHCDICSLETPIKS